MHGADLWIIHVMEQVPFAYSDPMGAMLETLASLEAELDNTAATNMARIPAGGALPQKYADLLKRKTLT